MPDEESALRIAGSGQDRESIRRLAYRLWEERGRPIGSPDVDWARAEDEFRRACSAQNLPFSDIAMEPEEM
jgi:hypothetical protein